jgi:hypothetical protein
MKTSGVQEGCRLGLRPDLIAQFILSFWHFHLCAYRHWLCLWWFGVPSNQERPPRWKNQQRKKFFTLQSVMLLPVLYIHACALCAHTRVSISGWLPHHCPFPELGPFSVSLCYTLIWLGEQCNWRPYMVQGLLRIPSISTS